jgi:tRNA(fMet)-specific endonuclease VapC
MNRFLLDTNILSEALKTTPDTQVMSMLQRYEREVATAAPVWHEMQYGCMRLPPSRKRELIEAYLRDVVWRTMDILAYNDRAAAWHAQVRAQLTARGQKPSFVDGQIAAIARVNELILVTRNTSDFEGFADLEVVKWHLRGSDE